MDKGSRMIFRSNSALRHACAWVAAILNKYSYWLPTDRCQHSFFIATTVLP